jgi:hypothetical protein
MYDATWTRDAGRDQQGRVDRFRSGRAAMTRPITGGVAQEECTITLPVPSQRCSWSGGGAAPSRAEGLSGFRMGRR